MNGNFTSCLAHKRLPDLQCKQSDLTRFGYLRIPYSEKPVKFKFASTQYSLEITLPEQRHKLTRGGNPNAIQSDKKSGFELLIFLV